MILLLTQFVILMREPQANEEESQILKQAFSRRKYEPLIAIAISRPKLLGITCFGIFG
jgi:hypothetical protein